MNKHKYIAVFCSAIDLEEKYIKPAQEFARMMAKNGYYLVWGGSNTGLMRTMAEEVQKGGEELIAVTIDLFKSVVKKDANEVIVATSLGERKATMLLKADAIVVLVGGVGTLDEAMEVIELKKENQHNKPIVLLNTDNFYTGLKHQLQRMQNEGFMHKHVDELVYFADTPEAAMEYISEKLSS